MVYLTTLSVARTTKPVASNDNIVKGKDVERDGRGQI
jgi:hypothetical protein